MREKRHTPPTPAEIANHQPMLFRLAFPRHPVIPAKAGIHTPAGRDTPGFWIPACAGMTVGAHPRPSGYAGVLDSGLRRNDGAGVAPAGRDTPGFWIPASAGMPVGAHPRPTGYAGVLDSSGRRNDGAGRLGGRRDTPGFWIPAYAGMTVGGGPGPRDTPGFWIPACAGMTVWGDLASGDSGAPHTSAPIRNW